MVFDVPAEDGGALSVLNDFYNEVSNINDKNSNWIFVISTPTLNETENIKVLRFPWIKKSWAHRYFFDQFVAPKLVKKHKVDKVFSLQNVTIPHLNCEQILYVHQSLPFVEYKFSFTENKLFWIYQNIIGKKIIHSIKSAQKVIVQTEWMKAACLEKTMVNEEKIKVVPPKINIEIEKFFSESEKNLSTFFYPAGASYYKNHRIIVEACRELKKKEINGYKVFFTLKGNENTHIADLYKIVQEMQLPIYFIGSISRAQVFDFYTKSILLFPSYIETFGLPLLESKLHKGMILTADTPFSHEVLDVYPNAYFFDAFNSIALARLMKQIFDGEISYREASILKQESKENLKEYALTDQL